MKAVVTRWRRSRAGQWMMVAVIAYVLFLWYEDLRSEATQAWIAAHGTDGTWATVFLMGLAVGIVVGATCGPLLIEPKARRKGQSAQPRQ